MTDTPTDLKKHAHFYSCNYKMQISRLLWNSSFKTYPWHLTVIFLLLAMLSSLGFQDTILSWSYFLNGCSFSVSSVASYSSHPSLLNVYFWKAVSDLSVPSHLNFLCWNTLPRGRLAHFPQVLAFLSEVSSLPPSLKLPSLQSSVPLARFNFLLYCSPPNDLLHVFLVQCLCPLTSMSAPGGLQTSKFMFTAISLLSRTVPDT